MMLQNQRHLFSLPDDVCYLNCSYMSPMLKSVAEQGIRGIYRKNDPSAIQPKHFFEPPDRLRSEFARLIDADDPSYCVVIPSVSYGMAVVAKNLKAGKGDNIVIAHEQFPSNVYAWKVLEKEKGIRLRSVAPPVLPESRGRLWNESLLEAIDTHTKMVAIGHVHWADGTRFDLEAIRKRADEVGAIIVIDGTQSIGALPFSVKTFRPDAVVSGGYKWLMGPYSLGVAYFGEYFRAGQPIENNWINRLHSEDFTNLVSYQDEYQPGSIRYEGGESANFILAPMLTEALKQINAWGPQAIQDYCEALAKPYLSELVSMGFQIESPDYRGHHILGIRLPENLPLDRIKTRFSEKKIHVSFRGNAVRVSPHVYNTSEDLEKLLEGFKWKSYA